MLVHLGVCQSVLEAALEEVAVQSTCLSALVTAVQAGRLPFNPAMCLTLARLEAPLI